MLGHFSRSNSHERASTGHIATGRAGWLAVPLSILVAAACSTDDGGGTQPGYNPVTGTAAGTTAGTAPGTTAGTVGGTTAGTVATTAGTSTGSTAGTVGGSLAGTGLGTTAGTGLGTTAGAGASPGATGGSATGGMTGGATGGGMPAGNNFVKCDTKGTEPNTKACGSFVSSAGVELPYGPYGGMMEPNVGMGFEAPGDDGGAVTCDLFAGIFAEDADATTKLLDVSKLKLELHTVYRPAVWPQGKVPIITWGNGTCAQPEGYGSLLRYVASYGFVVVAPNNRFVGSGDAQKKGLDFLFKANDDAMSPYYQKLDTSKVAAMGHSQGGMGTTAASSDARIKTVILFNGGTSASKPFLALSGDMDVSGQTAAQFSSAVMGSSQPKVAWLYYHMVPATGSISGHLTLMTQPERVAPATVAWLKMMLLDDADSKTYFSGSSCKLCGKAADYEFGQKGL